MNSPLGSIGIIVGIAITVFFFLKLLVIEEHPEVIGIGVGVLMIILALNIK